MKIIKNESDQVIKDEFMNEEDILNDIMLSEKNIEKSFTKYSKKLSELS